MDYRKQLVVAPGSRVRLADIDPSSTGRLRSREEAQAQIGRQLERIDRLQYLLYADAARSLLIVLQALDAGGKDGVIRHLFSGLNPQGTSVAGFKGPTQAELAHDFLWRAHLRAPGRGEVVINNRSHYEGVLIERVHKLVPRPAWSKRYQQILDYERLLIENGTCILKFYLHISPEEQLARFKRRLDDPMRHWKISENDYVEREFWPQYLRAYEEAMRQTSTKWAPWYVIPANHKWFRDLAISTIVADAMEDMRLKPPRARVDLAQIRRKYHRAARAEHER